MTRNTLGAAFMAAALIAAGAARADEDETLKPVKLPAETQRKLGLVTQPLAAAARSEVLNGYVKVLDAGPLAQLDSDLEAAEATAAASAAEAARSRTLNAADQAVSTRALQAAQAQARADASRLALLRRRIGLEWGAVARLSPRQRASLIAGIAAGRTALVRIDTASGQGLSGLRAVDMDLGSLGHARAVVLGPARTADVRLLSPGIIATVTGLAAAVLANGLSLPVKLTASAPVQGVIAPRAALLRSGGRTWLYVRTGGEEFLRKPVDGGRIDPGGLFVTEGLKPGEPVVTTAAAALFAAETNVAEEGD